MPPRFDILSKSSHVPYVSLTIAEALSACFSPLPALTVILFPSFCPPIYLSPPFRPFPSYLFVYRSIPDFSLAVHFHPFPSPTLPAHRPLTSCANVPKSIYDITACSRATSSPTDSTKAGAFYLVFYFPLPLPRDIPTNPTPTPLTPPQSSRQTVRYLT